MLGTMENYPFWGFSVRLRFADDHALDDRRRLAGYSLARPRGALFLRDLVWRRPVPAPDN